MNLEALLDDFAVRSFRDIGDSDYIAARMACRAALVTQFLWASEQTIEKYLKCILLLNRIPAKDVRKINATSKLTLDLRDATTEFIKRLDMYGQYRYFEASNVGFGIDLITLDRAVWEVRRYCTLAIGPRQAKLQEGFPAPRVRIPGGFLEKVIDNVRSQAREPLLWQNAFFGKRGRKEVRLSRWFQAHNSPLYLNPQILDEVLKYVYLPKDVEAAYRVHMKP